MLAVKAKLEDIEALIREEKLDLVLANPPYFSKFRIARAFVATAAEHLRPGGELWMVAKAAEKHAALFDGYFEDVSWVITKQGHALIRGVRNLADFGSLEEEEEAEAS